jgi:hypothetical protein
MKTANFNIEKIRSLDMRRLLKALHKALKDNEAGACKDCTFDCRGCIVNRTAREAASKIEGTFRQSTMFGGA